MQNFAADSVAMDESPIYEIASELRRKRSFSFVVKNFDWDKNTTKFKDNRSGLRIEPEMRHYGNNQTILNVFHP